MTVTRRIIAATVCAPLLCALLFNTGMAQAQNPVAAPSAIPAISGSTLEKKAFNLAALKGKVVLISVDRRFADVESYNTILSKLAPIKQRFTQLWAGKAGYKDNLDTANLPANRLPTTLLIDKQGRLVQRFSGRIPAEVWDKISDLL